ncbi:MAG: hypothetical protein ACOY4L_06890 [Pseudomonadota bacterium]
MEKELNDCLDRAIQELEDFPDNPHARLLRAASREITRMLQTEAHGCVPAADLISGR